MLQSKMIIALREHGPQTFTELKEEHNVETLTAEQRLIVEKLHVCGRNGSTPSLGRLYKVYYLYGDERQAVRKYIETNRSVLEQIDLQSGHNRVRQAFDEYMYRILLEEWYLDEKLEDA